LKINHAAFRGGGHAATSAATAATAAATRQDGGGIRGGCAFGATGGAFGQTGGTFGAQQAGGFGGGFGGGGASGANPTTSAFGAPTGGAFGAPAAGGFGQTGGFPLPTEPRESAAAPRSALDSAEVRMNLDDLESQVSVELEQDIKVSVELEQDIFSLWTVSIFQDTSESAGANKWLIYFCASFTLLLQFLIVLSILFDRGVEIFVAPEFTENTLVEVTVPTERNGLQPWLVRDGDMKYNVYSPALAAGLNSRYWADKNTFFWSDTLFWNVPKNHTLYHTHAKTFDIVMNSWTTTMCRFLALILLGLNLGREFMDICQVLAVAVSLTVQVPRMPGRGGSGRGGGGGPGGAGDAGKGEEGQDDAAAEKMSAWLSASRASLKVHLLFQSVTYSEKYPHRAFT